MQALSKLDAKLLCANVAYENAAVKLYVFCTGLSSSE